MKKLLLSLFILPIQLFSQNVGIGTATPTNGKLIVSGSTALTQLLIGPTGSANVSIDVLYPMIGFNNYYNSGYKAWNTGYSGKIVFEDGSGSLLFQNSSASFATDAAISITTALVINKNQLVGIGDIVPAYKLDVADRMRLRTGVLNNITTTPGIWYDDYRTGTIRSFAGMQDSIRWGVYGGGTGGVGWMSNFNAKSGNVNFGNTTNDTYRLTLSGKDYALGFYNEAGNYFGNVTSNATNDLQIESSYGSAFLGGFPATNILLNPPSSYLFSFPGNVGVNTSTPNASLHVGGDVYIGTSAGTPATGYKLSVKGKIICEEAKVQLSASWPDYVFADNYQLMSLDNFEKNIKALKHLPNIPAAKEMEANGIELGDMNRRLLEKVEELSLYIIQLNNRLKTLEKVANQ